MSANVMRRHLDESQRGLIAARMAQLPHGGDRKSDQRTNSSLDWRMLTQNINSSFKRLSTLHGSTCTIRMTFASWSCRHLVSLLRCLPGLTGHAESSYATAGFNRGVFRSQTLPPMDVTERYGVPGNPGQIGDLEALYEAPSEHQPDHLKTG